MFNTVFSPNNEFLITYQRRIANIKAELGITTSKYEPENLELLREDLLGVRHRGGPKGPDTADLDQVINFHENMQQKITDDMLILTKSLKEQSELANRIIKKDTEVCRNLVVKLALNNFCRLFKDQRSSLTKTTPN